METGRQHGRETRWCAQDGGFACTTFSFITIGSSCITSFIDKGVLPLILIDS